MSKASEELAAQWRADAERFAGAIDDGAFLRTLRESARTHFAELGLPARNLEAWRKTSLAPIEKAAWQTPDPSRQRVTPISKSKLLEGLDPLSVVLVDGEVHEQCSAEGVSVRSLRDFRGDDAELEGRVGALAETKQESFVALSTAFLDDGALIEIEPNAALGSMVHVDLVSASPGAVSFPRLAIVARTGSRATIVIEQRSEQSGPHLAVLVAEVTVEAGAHLDLVVVQQSSQEDCAISSFHTQQARDSALALHTLTLGGRLVRNDLRSVLSAPGAEIDMRGLFLGTGDSHLDNHTVADHAVPHTTSRELYKGILAGRAKGVFCGRVIVRPDAQKTDSSQANPNLLLSPKSEIDTQPQLEIYADDVKCSHGSTIGQLDADALFYLRSRGIGEADARVMLTRGFAHEVIDALPQADLAERVGARVEAALTRAIEDEARGPRE